MKYLITFFICIVFLTFTSCKKDRLDGESIKIIGNWEWVESPVSGSNPSTSEYNLTLKFEAKGKYEIEKNGNKIESGRTIINNEKGNTYCVIELKRNSLFKKSEIFGYDNLAIWMIGNDTMEVTSAEYFDLANYIFVRKN